MTESTERNKKVITQFELVNSVTFNCLMPNINKVNLSEFTDALNSLEVKASTTLVVNLKEVGSLSKEAILVLMNMRAMFMNQGGDIVLQDVNHLIVDAYNLNKRSDGVFSLPSSVSQVVE